jgi:hypothetical protein
MDRRKKKTKNKTKNNRKSSFFILFKRKCLLLSNWFFVLFSDEITHTNTHTHSCLVAPPPHTQRRFVLLLSTHSTIFPPLPPFSQEEHQLIVITRLSGKIRAENSSRPTSTDPIISPFNKKIFNSFWLFCRDPHTDRHTHNTLDHVMNFVKKTKQNSHKMLDEDVWDFFWGRCRR